ncbi:MAG: alpha/beta hydrolase [Bacteroidota bacterium]
MKTGFVTSGRYPVRYRDQGSGMPLLFLHGYLESLNIWSDFTRAFAGSFRVISMDLPGHGQSGVPGTVSTMDEMAGAAVRLLDKLGVGICFVIGHSMGGYATLAMLERHPGRLNGFCLFHSHARADTSVVIEKRSREIRIVEEGHSLLLAQQNVPNMFAEDNLPLFQKELRYTQRIVRKTPDAGIIAAIRGMMTRPDRSAILANATVPCLHIIGKKDKYIPFEEVALNTILPAGSERLILEHTGHMGFFEEKARAYAEMLRFLKKI